MEDEYDEQGNIYQTASPLQAGSFNRECARDWSYYLMAINHLPISEDESRQRIAENSLFVAQSVTVDFLFLMASYLVFLVSSGQIKLAES